jgi:hypothetical protein
MFRKARSLVTCASLISASAFEWRAFGSQERFGSAPQIATLRPARDRSRADASSVERGHFGWRHSRDGAGPPNARSADGCGEKAFSKFTASGLKDVGGPRLFPGTGRYDGVA